MKDTLKQLWLVTKYVLGFSKNFARVLILAILEILIFFGVVTLTVNLLHNFAVIAFIICLVELLIYLLLLDSLICTAKTKLQKKYNIHEDD